MTNCISSLSNLKLKSWEMLVKYENRVLFSWVSIGFTPMTCISSWKCIIILNLRSFFSSNKLAWRKKISFWVLISLSTYITHTKQRCQPLTLHVECHCPRKRPLLKSVSPRISYERHRKHKQVTYIPGKGLMGNVWWKDNVSLHWLQI